MALSKYLAATTSSGLIPVDSLLGDIENIAVEIIFGYIHMYKDHVSRAV